MEIKISLEAARRNAKLTQKDVAKALGVSNKTVCNWETGRAEPSFATLKVLSDMYRIPINYITLPSKSS